MTNQITGDVVAANSLTSVDGLRALGFEVERQAPPHGQAPVSTVTTKLGTIDHIDRLDGCVWSRPSWWLTSGPWVSEWAFDEIAKAGPPAVERAKYAIGHSRNLIVTAPTDVDGLSPNDRIDLLYLIDNLRAHQAGVEFNATMDVARSTSNDHLAIALKASRLNPSAADRVRKIMDRDEDTEHMDVWGFLRPSS